MGICLSDLAMVSQLAGWPTPMAGTPAQNGNNAAGNNDSSRKTEELAGWNTPRATDGSNGGPNQTGGALPADASMAGWPSPNAQQDNRTTEQYTAFKSRFGKVALTDLQVLAREVVGGWLTPSANEAAAGTEKGKMQTMLSHQALLTGSEANGTTAVTAKPAGYRLNPLFSLWLMGYPVAWASCGVPAMPSSRK